MRSLNAFYFNHCDRLFMLFLCILNAGDNTVEVGKTIWGSSTRALDRRGTRP